MKDMDLRWIVFNPNNWTRDSNTNFYFLLESKRVVTLVFLICIKEVRFIILETYFSLNNSCQYSLGLFDVLIFFFWNYFDWIHTFSCIEKVEVGNISKEFSTWDSNFLLSTLLVPIYKCSYLFILLLKLHCKLNLSAMALHSQCNKLWYSPYIAI